MTAIPLLETELKQICTACGKEHSGKSNHKINGKIHKGVCFSCIKKERYNIYISNPRSKDRVKERHKNYYGDPIIKNKHKEAMKIYHERTRPTRVRKSALLRGLEANVFINQPFIGSAAHHIDKKTVVYIPNWLHSALPHRHNMSGTMVMINDWSNRWIELEKAHKGKKLKMKLLKFYEFYLNSTLVD